ncbi:MAG: hypothetical protein ACMUIL_10145 [bacterium]
MFTLILWGMAAIMLAGPPVVRAQKQDDKPSNAVSLTPNGSSAIYSFSFPDETQWFTFFAEEGLSYQIFTKTGYPPAYTIISLYDEEFEESLDSNDILWDDGSSLVDWVCPAAGDYFIKVENYNGGNQYGPHEYSIQVTSPDLEIGQMIIQGVPDYWQVDYGYPDPYPGNCGPVAAACVLGYWDAHGYPLLVDNDPANIEDVAKLVEELQRAMEYPSQSAALGGVHDDFVPIGIERVCNTSLYDNDYEFRAILQPPDFRIVMDEIAHKRPLLYGVSNHSIWGDHWMVTIGYLITPAVNTPTLNRPSTYWTINHDTWSSTPRDVYVDWDEAKEWIVTIQPGKRYVPPSGSVSTGSYFPVAPTTAGFGTLPVFGIGFTPYPIMPTIHGAVWSYPWGAGGISPATSMNYLTTASDITGSISQQWPMPQGTGWRPFASRGSQATYIGNGENLVSNFNPAANVPAFSYEGIGGMQQGYSPLSMGYPLQQFLISPNPLFISSPPPFFSPGVVSFPVISPFSLLGLYPYGF